MSSQFDGLDIEEIISRTVAIIKPGDKVIVLLPENSPHSDVARLAAKCAEFFGEGNALVAAGDIDFFIMRQEQPQP